MAGVIGGAGGYATVGPTRNYIGEAMSNVQDNMFRQNAQRTANEKAIQEREQAIQDKANKKTEKAIAYAEKHKLTQTGVKSIDRKNLEFSLKMQQLSIEGEEELSRATTLDEKVAAMSKIRKSISGFDVVNKFNNDYTARKEDVLKNKNSYDPNHLADMAEEGKKFDNGQWEYNIDEDNNVSFSTHDINPATGKVMEVTAENLTADQMVSKFNGLPKSNYAGEGDGVSFLDNFSKRIKDKKEETKANGRIITNYPTAIADAEAAAKAAVADPSLRFNVRTQIAKATNVSKGEVTDEQVFEKILTDVKSLIPAEKNEVDHDERNFNYKVQQDRISNANESTRIGIAKEVAAKDKKGVRFTVKNGLLGQETSATMDMTEGEYADYLIKNGVKDVKTLDEIWNNPINAGYAKAVQNSPTKAKVEEKPKVKYGNIVKTNKNNIGLKDETWHDINTGKKLEDNQVVHKEDIKKEAKASGYSEKEYTDLLTKKGIYIIQ